MLYDTTEILQQYDAEYTILFSRKVVLSSWIGHEPAHPVSVAVNAGYD